MDTGQSNSSIESLGENQIIQNDSNMGDVKEETRN